MARKEPRGGKAPASASVEWDSFEVALAGALAGMPHNRYIVIADEQTRHGVRFGTTDLGVLAETPGNPFLPPASRHDARHLAALAALGWVPPGPEASPLPNHYMTAPHPLPSRELAHIARRTLEEVCGIARPSGLTLQAWDFSVRDGQEHTDRVLSPQELGLGGIVAGDPRPSFLRL